MKILFSMGHPAHFQLFKNIITELDKKGHSCIIVIRKKDILEGLLSESGLTYHNILPEDRKNGKWGMIWSIVKRDLRLYKLCRKYKPDLMLGSTVEITHVGKLMGIPAVTIGEDDMDVVPIFSKLVSPFSDCLLTPEVCRTGKWEYKSIKYHGYQKLIYLHPNHFIPDKEIVKRYLDPDKPYFLLRFSGLSAHHDGSIKGINTVLAYKIINILKPYGDIYITSERKLEDGLEQYRLAINFLDIHHIMAFSTLYIGDSQSMSVEAAMLGVPSIRINSFAGRISVLEELEYKYGLTFGIKPENEIKIFTKLNELLIFKNLKEEFQNRRQKMLSEKIDVCKFYVWFIENFPESKKIMKENPDFQFNFK